MLLLLLLLLLLPHPTPPKPTHPPPLPYGGRLPCQRYGIREAFTAEFFQRIRAPLCHTGRRGRIAARAIGARAANRREIAAAGAELRRHPPGRRQGVRGRRVRPRPSHLSELFIRVTYPRRLSEALIRVFIRDTYPSLYPSNLSESLSDSIRIRITYPSHVSGLAQSESLHPSHLIRVIRYVEPEVTVFVVFPPPFPKPGEVG